ncbi:MAG: NusG domain II-containing protein [bacterium]|nr:NusG domain II-containing protein [bacterium]MCM1374145.1 NusG domain II-containing protein [Muribaculum sp.]
MNTLKKRACLLTGCILIILTGSVLALFLARSGAAAETNAPYTAYIYQNGHLTQTIPLSQIQQTYTFTVETAAGGSNTVEISPDGVAVTQADCPDQICVQQGRITNSLLPITCLPHRLVIELKQENASADALTY